jgi:hypothetical protein
MTWYKRLKRIFSGDEKQTDGKAELSEVPCPSKIDYEIAALPYWNQNRHELPSEPYLSKHRVIGQPAASYLSNIECDLVEPGVIQEIPQDSTRPSIMSLPAVTRSEYISRREELTMCHLFNPIPITSESVAGTQQGSATAQSILPLGGSLGQPGCSPWIDIDRLQSWLRTCDFEHENHCHATSEGEGFLLGQPQWLIDVEDLCLSPAWPRNRYIALSYVWGKVETVRALVSNLRRLQTKGALSDDSTEFTLPRTIRDTINVVKILGERFLWVDCLCIVQDDREVKYTQLGDMASIYANAYVTIIAAEADNASHGLRGIQGYTPPRDYSGPARKYSNRNDALLAHHRNLSISVWYSRGWTFQEFLFSPRAIIFQKDGVDWECNCAVWDEGTPLSDLKWDHTSQIQSPKTRLNFRPWPNLHEYMDIVKAYNKRHFTYPEDALAAFAGVTASLDHIYDGGFLCGLPEMFFDVGLLWSNDVPLERRFPVRPDAATLPSWSWAGWQGHMNLEAWGSCVRDYSKRSKVVNGNGRRLRIKLTPQWYCSNEPFGEPRPIHRAYQNYRTSCNEVTQPLPPGWRRYQSEDGYFYTHESDPQSEFWYPIPLRNSETGPVTRTVQGYLSCRTRRAFFPAIECPGKSLRALLKTHAGQVAGEINSHQDVSWTINDDKIVYEVAMVSEYTSIEEGQVKHGYNVLWIEWKGGIAYRKGVGTIYKDVFDSHPYEWISLTLG